MEEQAKNYNGEPSPSPYLRKEHDSRRGPKNQSKILSPSPIQCGWETTGHALTEGTRTDRWNDAGQTERRLARQNVAWVWPTTIA